MRKNEGKHGRPSRPGTGRRGLDLSDDYSVAEVRRDFAEDSESEIARLDAPGIRPRTLRFE
jgi:hypothetical protein